MSKRRPIARAFFLVSLAVLLGSIFRFTWRQQYTCLGVPFLAASPAEESYAYYDYSQSLFFSGEKAPMDVESSTIYISQSISEGTSFTDLQGRLTCSFPGTRMYFLEDPLFEDLASAAAENHPFALLVRSGDSFMRYRVIFTTLPVFSIEDPDHTELQEKGVYAYGTFRAWTPNDPELEGYTVKSTPVRWNLRGGTATVMPKKSIKLTLQKSDGTKRNMELLGMGSDDDWILNPMSLDDFKVKENLLMTLWNELAQENDWDVRMSTGNYCEIVMNGRYRGLYLLQRRIDRKYLNLEPDQILLKGEGGSMSRLNKPEGYSIIYSKLTDAQTYDLWLDLQKNRFGQSVNLRNYADVSLFVQFGYMQDNSLFRNIFYLLSPRDGDYELQLILWDTDMSMGLVKDFAYNYEESIHTTLNRADYEKVQAAHSDLDQVVAARWFQLRQRVFAEEHLLSTLERLSGQIAASGAMERDYDRWGLYVSSPRPLEDFIRDRLEFLDGYYAQLLAS